MMTCDERISHWLTFLAIVFVMAFSTVDAVCSAADQDQPVSKKRGLGVSTRKDSQWSRKLETLNAHWFYTWGAEKPKGAPANVDFTPMIWGRSTLNNHKLLKNLQEEVGRGEIQYLLGFNEPDQKKQGNLTVSEVVELWPQLEALGVPLCSPGCVHPDRPWMIEFMQEVEKRKLRVDYVCVHSYGGPSAESLINRLKKIHEMYDRPIWITEFAVGDWKAKSVAENKHSPKKVAQFMREVLPMLEELDFVQRYAWFSASPDSAPLGTSTLFNKDGTLTELGKIYGSFKFTPKNR